MKIRQDFAPYVTGQRFQSGLRVFFEYEPADREFRERADILVDLCRGKRIVHLGCVDHNLDIVRSKMQAGRWLHGRLLQAAARCIGVDINAEGIRRLTTEVGIPDLHCADITRDPLPFIEAESWDYLLVPELIEHIGNPVAFLSAIRERTGDRFERVILTTPNAFGARNFIRILRGFELVNSDHRFWFTPFTLSKVLDDAGFEVEHIHMCQNPRIRHKHVFDWLKNLFFRRYPLFRGTMIVVARVRAG